MAYYLDYRPQKIKDLDILSVREALGNILKAKKIPHSFLFVGPKGTGKTSSARILAKVVNCTNKSKDNEPCDKCDSCQLINTGKSMDLIEIDAASNRGIDDIRELREKINLSPAQATYKVYIIDEVHMLTNEAFNALLKTLEEPPKHAKFVLCTTEPHKLPGTIVSRCFQVDFVKAQVSEVEMALKKVVKGEKLKIEKGVLNLIAKKSNGSFRDAVKWLEQLGTMGKEIKLEQANKMLGGGFDSNTLEEWLVLVYKKEAKKALDQLVKLGDQGHDFGYLAVEIVDRLRRALLAGMKVKNFKGDEIKGIGDVETLRRLTDLMMKASIEVKKSTIESLPIELAIAEWSKQTVSGDDLGEKKVELAKDKEAVKSNSGELKIEEVQLKWGEVLKALRPYNHSLEALLRATKPTGFEGDRLVLEVFYKFHKERLEVDKYKQLVEKVSSKVLVAPIKVRYILREKSTKTINNKSDDNLSGKVEGDIVKTAEEVFGVKID